MAVANSSIFNQIESEAALSVQKQLTKWCDHTKKGSGKYACYYCKTLHVKTTCPLFDSNQYRSCHALLKDILLQALPVPEITGLMLPPQAT